MYDDSYEQPHTAMNHYQDISVRRVIAELVDDPEWPDVVETSETLTNLIDLNDGQTHHLPRARGFRGDYLFQIREPISPGFCLTRWCRCTTPHSSPACPTMKAGSTKKAAPTSP